MQPGNAGEYMRVGRIVLIFTAALAVVAYLVSFIPASPLVRVMLTIAISVPITYGAWRAMSAPSRTLNDYFKERMRIRRAIDSDPDYHNLYEPEKDGY